MPDIAKTPQTKAPQKHMTAVARARLHKDEAQGAMDAVASSPHGDNVNPNAYSAESARKLGDARTHSINEPGPGAPKPFKVPEDHTLTTPETLAQDYPDGYVAPQEPLVEKTTTLEDAYFDNDPDDLEDEIDQAKDDGDFKPTHRTRKSHIKKGK